MYIKDIRVLKSDLRARYKRLRKELNPSQKRRMDEAIQEQFWSLKQYSRCSVLFVYVSKDIEVNTLPIIERALKDHKLVAAPRCRENSTDMDFYRIRSMEDLEPASFGVLEPIVECCEKITDFSSGLCIVPGLCYDSQGFRLGYGKGYYDRFLSRYQGDTVGLCYSSCIQWKLPHGRFDHPVDLLLTDKYLRRTAQKKKKSADNVSSGISSCPSEPEKIQKIPQNCKKVNDFAPCKFI